MSTKLYLKRIICQASCSHTNEWAVYLRYQCLAICWCQIQWFHASSLSFVVTRTEDQASVSYQRAAEVPPLVTASSAAGADSSASRSSAAMVDSNSASSSSLPPSFLPFFFFFFLLFFCSSLFYTSMRFVRGRTYYTADVLDEMY